MKGRVHELKIKSKFYRDILHGIKTFEVRKNDRGFKLGDFLALNEIDDEGQYTGCSVLVKVIYILDDEEYVKEGMVILGIERCYIITETENRLRETEMVHLDPDSYGTIARCE